VYTPCFLLHDGVKRCLVACTIWLFQSVTSVPLLIEASKIACAGPPAIFNELCWCWSNV